MRWTAPIIAAAALVAASAPARACREAVVLTPARDAVIGEGRPIIAWQAVPGAAQYRLELESRIPNGRVIARFDQQVAGTQFTPPQTLADEQAVVKVRVTSGCGPDAFGPVSELGPRFVVDARDLCPAPRDLVAASGPDLRLQWSPEAKATRTEVALFDGIGGRLLARESVMGSSLLVPMPKEPFAIAARNRCRESVSRTVYRVVAPAAR